MATVGERETSRRTPLSRERVLSAAVAYADARGLDALSMRGLAEELGVVPMALYKHVADKDDMLDGMLALVVGEIEQTPATGRWRDDVRRRVLAARRALIRHPWSRTVLESRPMMTAAMLDHLDGLVGLFLEGGLSAGLTHHAMHVLGNRMWGFNPELFAATPASDPTFASQRQALPARFPHLAAIAQAAEHDEGTSEGGQAHDQTEFEFALDLILDGVHRRA